ncbi:hypothetical protein [Tissierella praeacuta]|uniref:hypothetical protein n=1 Tax=Tissierella praeacuta TaxID=43131 RepID=UPI0028A8D677|nr:hypothetical protein [Tissierella praeacuta]
MCGNPFKIHEKVDGSYEVEEITTNFIGIYSDFLKWRETEEGLEVLTLDEILEQTIEKKYQIHKNYKGKGCIPCIRVIYETGLWGVIFEVRNYPSLGKQWIVHGTTKGYA